MVQVNEDGKLFDDLSFGITSCRYVDQVSHLLIPVKAQTFDVRLKFGVTGLRRVTAAAAALQREVHRGL
jgi:hypothetical protein